MAPTTAVALVKDMDRYRGKLILAPMVRCGSTPMRTLALKYGADLVYSPEIVDRRLSRSIRVENVLLDTIDFVDKVDGSLNLRIAKSETDRLVVQLGSSDPENAVLAAKMILSALTSTIPLPITCKIRMLATVEDTIGLVKRIEGTGVSAVALHCRQRHERPQDPGHWDIFQHVAKEMTVPLIANGDLFGLDDIAKLKKDARYPDTFTLTQAVSSFMLARGPESNFSVFSSNPLSTEEAIRVYLGESIKWDMPFHNAKYVVIQMWSSGNSGMEKNRVAPVKSFGELCRVFGLEDLYERSVKERAKMAEELGRTDLLSKEVIGVLGPDCPYIPEPPYLPTKPRGISGKEKDGGDKEERVKKDKNCPTDE
ncbi:tRNA-dihydrouridine(20) synthase [NAD(P)+]-like [Phlyctochytrium planicorne]|nr:tRNA-dihydrouridine(20) synthase [NAD(P)+]-like [Phlyctochytrium planicorne]